MQLSKQGIETLEQRRVLSGVPFTGLTLESPGLTEINRLSQDAVDVGDINGDGRVDVLAYSIQSSKLFSMFREENGELGQPKVVAEDFGVLTLSLDDIDGDSDVDIVVGGAFGLGWYENVSGMGEFISRKIKDAHNVDQLWSTDTDGDDLLDIVTWSRGHLQVFQNDGLGGFVESQTLDDIEPVIGIERADLDSDGDDDFVQLHLNGVSSVINQEGQFQRAERIAGDVPGFSLSVGDYDGDGDTDVAIVSPGCTSILENDLANGEFKHHPADFEHRAGGFFAVSADLDGDGRAEIITDYGNQTTVYEVNADFVLEQSATIDAKYVDVVVGDIYGNGTSGVVDFSSDKGVVQTLELAGDTYEPSQVLFDGNNFDSPTSPQFVDWDADGDLDVIALSPISGEVVWYEFDQTTRLFKARERIVGDLIDAQHSAVYDLDNDGDLDLLVSVDNGERLTWVPNSAGQFHEAIELFSPENSYISDIQVADLDGDNDLEPVFRVRRGGINWIENMGEGVFSSATGLETHGFGAFSIADVNGDGSLDIATFDWTERRPSVFFQSDLGFSKTVFGPTFEGQISSRDDVSLVLGDINGDGRPNPVIMDLRSPNRGKHLWFQLLANGEWTGQQLELDILSAASLIFSDVDGDGDQDIVRGSVQTRLYQNLGNDSFGPRADIPWTSDQVGRDLIAGDYDRDGDNDFLAYSDESDSLLIYRNETVSQSLRGDYNADERISLNDLEVLDQAIRDRVRRPELDLDLNGVVDAADRLALVALAEKPIGDANFDGVFDSSDLVQIMLHGGFERSQVDATWATGDFDGDGHFSTADLVLAFKGGAYVRKRIR